MAAPLSMPDKVDVKLGGGVSDVVNLIGPQNIGNLEFQFSEACEKRFIMFDQSGSRKRIIFHPALVCEFPFSVPDSFKASDGIHCFQDGSVGTVGQQQEPGTGIPAVDNHTDWSTRLMTYKETMAFAFSMLRKMRANSLWSPVDTGVEVPIKFPRANSESESSSRMSGNFPRPVGSGSHDVMHEDTEELEALLSSDDEVSTANSPSEVTFNNSTASHEDSNRTNRRKRRNGEESEVNSRFLAESDGVNSDGVFACGCKDSPVGVSPLINAGWELSIPSSQCRITEESSKCKNKLPSSGMRNISRQTCSENSATNDRYSCRASLEQFGSAKRSRKNKIKETVQMLRSIIPGGDCMETTNVLDEAIRYVKYLQVKAQLEGKKLQ